MDVKEYLQEIRKHDMMIQNKLVEVQQLRCLAISTSSPIGGDMVQGSRQGDRIGNIIAKIIDMENEIDDLIDEFIEVKNERISIMEKLPALQYQVLHKHYVQYKSLVMIAEEGSYSYQYIVETHGKALRTYENLLKPI